LFEDLSNGGMELHPRTDGMNQLTGGVHHVGLDLSLSLSLTHSLTHSLTLSLALSLTLSLSPHSETGALFTLQKPKTATRQSVLKQLELPCPPPLPPRVRERVREKEVSEREKVEV